MEFGNKRNEVELMSPTKEANNSLVVRTTFKLFYIN
jgi:hypothetical protein